MEPWQVAYRDVRILDWKNELQATYNLTDHNLANPDNRAALKELFLAAARNADSDRDGLPDSWEIHYFGDLSARPELDSDGDGVDNATEFAFGTDPRDPVSFLPAKALISRGAQNPGYIVFFSPPDRVDFELRRGNVAGS